MSEYKLTEGIINLSESNNWDEAKLEWVLAKVYEADEPDTCLCGHYPIREVCVLRNRENGNLTIVGNCCVKKFIGLPSQKIFDAIQRITKDLHGSLNIETIEHAYEMEWINKWERDFAVGRLRKTKWSEKQARIRVQINVKILNGFRNARQSK